jgi:hypothetical protein
MNDTDIQNILGSDRLDKGDILVLHLEVATIRQEDRPLALAYLRGFLEGKAMKGWNLEDSDERTVIGSAIRKYIAMIDIGDIESTIPIFKEEGMVYVDEALKMEYCKMLQRKFFANFSEDKNPYPNLSDFVFDIFKSNFDTDKINNSSMFSTLSVQAAEALLLMRSDHCEELMTILRETDIGWLNGLLENRIKRIIEGDDYNDNPSIADRFPERAKEILDLLERLK